MKLEVSIVDNKALIFLEESFLKPLLEDESITDISYNGKDIYYLHNELGRNKADFTITSEEAKSFLRHLANLSEQQFSYTQPILDITCGKYRVNATFSTISRKDNNKAFTFSIRIASLTPRITDESGFLDDRLITLFKVLLNNKVSMVIGGTTGTGKTELQKYLISSLKENTRVIIIDNVLELDGIQTFDHLDVSVWQADDRNNVINIQSLVKNGLRSNPDWMIVAESRGAEMIEVLNSSMTGHPIITTVHAYDCESIPNRMSRMVMMNDKKMDYKDVYYDICHHLPIAIFLRRTMINGKVHRYVEKVIETSIEGRHNIIYCLKDNKPWFGKFRFALAKRLRNVNDGLFISTFIGRDKEFV